MEEGECHCDRRGGLQRDARQKKKKIEGGKERQREKRKDESRNKKGKEDGDYAAREGEGRRSEKDKGAKGTEEENEKRLFTNVKEGKKRGKISAKRSGEWKKTGNAREERKWAEGSPLWKRRQGRGVKSK